ncbi:MAG: Na/Pi cotransporter family protein [Clostridia bacterium]|nr:Na/Pi cotransporter family protein [Clostridia bacterium]
MGIENIFALLGGLGLFLYGMQMMSNGLEAAAGNRMKKILEKLTSNRFLGVIVGAVITMVIQSSSATTVMVVGFVNSGMMTLQQAVWIIMGANIGTTVTGQLIALDIGLIAPLLAFIGVAMLVFLKKPSAHHFGQIIAGLGVLFIGMNMMSSSMSPLRDMPGFVSLMTKFSNPVLGILAGAVFTAIIQSSSASIGILQALALSGVIGLDNAVFVLFGQNIGTCITAVMASMGASRNAKRTTIIHLMFNLIGTTLFTILCLVLPVADWVASFTPTNVSAQIANMHTIFNITTSLLLIPFGTKLAQLAAKILPEREEEEPDVLKLRYIKKIGTQPEYRVGNSAIAINGIRSELVRMAEMTRKNIEESFSAVLEGNTRRLADAEKVEEYIDYLNKEISAYISGIIAYETNEEDSKRISGYFKVSGDMERIGDHAINICDYTKLLEKKKIGFSEQARSEIEIMRKKSIEAFDLLGDLQPMDQHQLRKISKFEEEIDDLTEEFRLNQIKRMHTGCCSDEACILYSEMLTDFERIGDHILNIGEALAKTPV